MFDQEALFSKKGNKKQNGSGRQNNQHPCFTKTEEQWADSNFYIFMKYQSILCLITKKKAYM